MSIGYVLFLCQKLNAITNTDICRPAGLVTLKTLLEASTPERPIQVRLFEAYVHGYGLGLARIADTRHQRRKDRWYIQVSFIRECRARELKATYRLLRPSNRWSGSHLFAGCRCMSWRPPFQRIHVPMLTRMPNENSIWSISTHTWNVSTSVHTFLSAAYVKLISHLIDSGVQAVLECRSCAQTDADCA